MSGNTLTDFLVSLADPLTLESFRADPVGTAVAPIYLTIW
jgi:hypothetical protein